MLTLKNIRKTFNPNTVNEKLAIKNLSLHLERGEFVTVVGSNGAGKSTLFNAISGGFYLDQGQVLLDNQDLTFVPDYKRANHVGRLFQDPMSGTAPAMTIEENLSLAFLRNAGHASPFGLSKADKAYLKSRVEALDLGLEQRMNSPVGLLSGGQRQALTLLMSTLITPKLLLLDEHTAALDPATAVKVMNLTNSIIAEHNLTCMMITHNISSALSVGTRTIMMNDGDIVLDISGKERENMTVESLVERFSTAANKELTSDRMLLEQK